MQKGKIAILGLVLLIAVLAASVVFAGPVRAQCRDGVDNDGDGRTDYPADPGCVNKFDKSELGTAQCDNGLDDDGDNLTDYPDDPGCSSPSDNSEFNAVQTCSDSDGGFAPFVKGTVTANNVSYTDFCNPSNTTSTTLNEYYCSGTTPTSNFVDCTTLNATSCFDGRCI